MNMNRFQNSYVRKLVDQSIKFLFYGSSDPDPVLDIGFQTYIQKIGLVRVSTTVFTEYRIMISNPYPIKIRAVPGFELFFIRINGSIPNKSGCFYRSSISNTICKKNSCSTRFLTLFFRIIGSELQSPYLVVCIRTRTSYSITRGSRSGKNTSLKYQKARKVRVRVTNTRYEYKGIGKATTDTSTSKTRNA